MIKICKECGKEFEAKNARQQYCNGPHFRPCPVCGKPVEIKYLSDPTPKCQDCRKHRVIPTPIAEEPKVEEPVVEEVTQEEPKTEESVVDTVEEPEAEESVAVKETTESESTPASEPDPDSDENQYVRRKYVGRSSAGFVTNHIYTVKLIPNPPYGYAVHAIEDHTENDEVNMDILISSMNSWRYFFKEV